MVRDQVMRFVCKWNRPVHTLSESRTWKGSLAFWSKAWLVRNDATPGERGKWFAFWVIVATMFALAAKASAGSYVFEKMFEDPSIRIGTALNDHGVVAIRLSSQMGNRILTTDGTVVTDIAGGSSNNKMLDTYAGSADIVLSVNDEGFVPFVGVASPGMDHGLIASNGATTRVIARDAISGGGFHFFTFGPLGPRSYQYHLSINDGGAVAFAAYDPGNPSSPKKIFVGDGTADPSLIANYWRDYDPYTGDHFLPAINNDGKVAHSARRGGPGTDFEVVVDTGPKILHVGPGPSYNQNSLLDINSSGQVLYWTAASGEFALGLGDGQSPATLVDTTQYARLDNGYIVFPDLHPWYALNDVGSVAFMAITHDLHGGIFVGPDPIRDKLIVNGDSLDGSTVNRVWFTRGGLNDLGQIAFNAELADGRVAVFRATPAELVVIPEPLTAVSALIGAVALALMSKTVARRTRRFRNERVRNE